MAERFSDDPHPEWLDPVAVDRVVSGREIPKHRLSLAEVTEAIRRMHALDMSSAEMAARLRISLDTVERLRPKETAGV